MKSGREKLILNVLIILAISTIGIFESYLYESAFLFIFLLITEVVKLKIEQTQVKSISVITRERMTKTFSKLGEITFLIMLAIILKSKLIKESMNQVEGIDGSIWLLFFFLVAIISWSKEQNE